jgi:hypothetical protein
LPEWRSGGRQQGGECGGWGVSDWRPVFVRLTRFCGFWPVVGFIPRWNNAFGAKKGPITGIRTIKKRFQASLACFERPSAVKEWEQVQTLQNETRFPEKAATSRQNNYQEYSKLRFPDIINK